VDQVSRPKRTNWSRSIQILTDVLSLSALGSCNYQEQFKALQRVLHSPEHSQLFTQAEVDRTSRWLSGSSASGDVHTHIR
jgi:hypothetical protein